MADSPKAKAVPYSRTDIMKPRQIDVRRTRRQEIPIHTRKARSQEIFNKRRINRWKSVTLDAQPAQLQESEKKDNIADVNFRKTPSIKDYIDETLLRDLTMKGTYISECWDKWHELWTGSTYRCDG